MMMSIIWQELDLFWRLLRLPRLAVLVVRPKSQVRNPSQLWLPTAGEKAFQEGAIQDGRKGGNRYRRHVMWGRQVEKNDTR